MSLTDQFNDDKLFLEAMRCHIGRCGNMADDQTKDQARSLAILDRYIPNLDRPK